MRFSSSSRGARLARRLAAHRLNAWDVPYDSAAHDDIVAVVAELTANAAQHGRVPGRDFRLLLRLTTDTVRIEVTDTRAERVPATPDASAGTSTGTSTGAGAVDLLAESGRGLAIVNCLTSTWGWHPRPDAPGKTVWAEYVLRVPTAP